jgi:hypothetical protein
MIEKGIIMRFEEPWGNKTIIKYKVSEKGRGEILSEKLEPYEVLFPRGETDKDKNYAQQCFAIAKEIIFSLKPNVKSRYPQLIRYFSIATNRRSQTRFELSFWPPLLLLPLK